MIRRWPRLVVVAIRLLRPSGLQAVYRQADFWERHWTQLWESMSLVILPPTIMLAVSLTTPIEYRNNTWKQVHASPQPPRRAPAEGNLRP